MNPRLWKTYQRKQRIAMTLGCLVVLLGLAAGLGALYGLCVGLSYVPEAIGHIAGTVVRAYNESAH